MSSSLKRTPKQLSTSTNKQTANKSIRIGKRQNGSQRPIANHLICERSPSLVRRRIEAQRTKNESVRKFREQIREVYHQTDGLSSFTQTSVLYVPPEVTSDRYLLGQYKYGSRNSSASNSEISSQYSQESEKALELEPDRLMDQIREQTRNELQEHNQQPPEESKTINKKPEKKQIQARNKPVNHTNPSTKHKTEDEQEEIKIDGSQYVIEPINNEEYEKENRAHNQNDDEQDESENLVEEEEEEIEFEIEDHEKAQNDTNPATKNEENKEVSSNFKEQPYQAQEEGSNMEFEVDTKEETKDSTENQNQEETKSTDAEETHQEPNNFNQAETKSTDVVDNSINTEVDNFNSNDNKKHEFANFDEIYNASQEEAETFDDHPNQKRNHDNFDEIYNASQEEPDSSDENKKLKSGITNFNELYDSVHDEAESLSQPEKNQDEEEQSFDEYPNETPNFAQTANPNVRGGQNFSNPKASTFSERQLKGQLHGQSTENPANNEIEIEADVEVDVDLQEEEAENDLILTDQISSQKVPNKPQMAPLNVLQHKVHDAEDDIENDYNPDARPLVSPRSYKSPFSPHSKLRTKFRLPSNDTSGIDPNLKRTGEQLLEISVRPFLYNLSIKYGEQIRRLREIPEFEFLDWKSMGFQWVWLYGVWKLGRYCLNFDLTDHDLIERYNGALPGWTSEDVIGYPLSIVSYDINPEIGDIDDLIWFRDKLKKLNIRLMLDYVPNHTAIDASEVLEHPEFYIHSKSSKIDANRFISEKGNIAYGAGINMPPMKFTAQLNIFNPATRTMQIENLLKISKYCDGVRVHLAHFLLTTQFAKQWNDEIDLQPPSTEFWKEAIDRVRSSSPSFVMMAESYGTENQSRLIECGFNFIYDKELIDHLVAHDVSGFRDLIFKNHFITDKMVHFIENHDEPRMIHRFGGSPKAAMTASAALLTLPGVRLFNMQQWLGYMTQIDVNLRRAPHEECNQEIVRFYTKLFNILESKALLYGVWKPMQVLDDTGNRIVAWKWVMDDQHILITFNFNNCWSQGRVICEDAKIDSMTIYVLEMISDTYYTRNSYELREKGLVLSMEPYQAQIFEY